MYIHIHIYIYIYIYILSLPLPRFVCLPQAPAAPAASGAVRSVMTPYEQLVLQSMSVLLSLLLLRVHERQQRELFLQVRRI